MNYNKMLSNRYKLVIKQLTHSMLKVLDLTRYDEPVTSKTSIKRVFKNEYLSTFLKVKKINKIKINKKIIPLIVVFTFITQGNTSAIAAQSSDHYKLYLHSKIVNYKQFTCAVEVAHRESRWNWRAVNGSHYGLFQMRNKKVQHMNPYTQINWWLRYVSHRYKGTPCLSLAHLKKEGWQ